jgi:G3E family GTPase
MLHTSGEKMSDRSAQAPVPLTILSGFLGAGKTTLLNHLLRSDHGLRVAVLVNDFGAINIDAQLVVGVEEDTVNLANGCICCTIREDLLRAALAVLRRPQPPEYLIIEASGVSEPLEIAITFLLPEVRPLVRLESILTVVDAEHAREWQPDPMLIRDQIAAADIVVLNKIDLVDEARRADLDTWIRSIAPRTRLLHAVEGQVPVRLVLGVGRYHLSLSAAQPGQEHHNHDHGATFATASYETERLLALAAVKEALKALPVGVFRAKGVLHVAEAPEQRLVAQVVGKRLTIVAEGTWGAERPRTQLVFIGATGMVDQAALTATLDLCAAADGSGAEASSPAFRDRLTSGARSLWNTLR